MYVICSLYLRSIYYNTIYPLQLILLKRSTLGESMRQANRERELLNLILIRVRRIEVGQAIPIIYIIRDEAVPHMLEKVNLKYGKTLYLS